MIFYSFHYLYPATYCSGSDSYEMNGIVNKNILANID